MLEKKRQLEQWDTELLILFFIVFPDISDKKKQKEERGREGMYNRGSN